MLMENLEEYKVLKIERIESMRDGKRSPNGLHILTFGTRTLPENVLCGYERFAVKQYYPNLLRCMVCCQYGHTKNWCNWCISYLLARKIFEEKIQASKKTYAEIAGKFIDDLARDEANELQDIKEKRLNIEKIFQEEKEENNKLKVTIRIREENAKLKQLIADMENEQKNFTTRANSPNRLHILR
jgi:hypothetical protein